MNSFILNIDSRNSQKKTDSSFKYKLNNVLKNAIEVKLSSIEIPKSQYFFTKKKDNNNFIITIKSKEYKFNLGYGNYSIDEIIKKISDFLQPLDVKIILQDNKKISFQSENNFDINFENTTKYNSLGKILGFNQLKYENKLLITSESSYNLDMKYLLLKINNFGNLIIDNKNYFTKIQNNKNYEGEIFEINQPINISQFDIEINDYLGNNIELNGLDVSLTLEIKILKNELLKKYFQNTYYDKNLISLIVKDNMLKYYQKNINV